MNYDRKHYDKPIGVEVLVQGIPCIVKKSRTVKIAGVPHRVCTGCILDHASTSVCLHYGCQAFEREDGQNVRFVLKK